MEKTIKEIEQIYKTRRDELKAGYEIKATEAFLSYKKQLANLKREENEDMLTLARQEAEERAYCRQLMTKEKDMSEVADLPDDF